MWLHVYMYLYICVYINICIYIYIARTLNILDIDWGGPWYKWTCRRNRKQAAPVCMSQAAGPQASLHLRPYLQQHTTKARPMACAWGSPEAAMTSSGGVPILLRNVFLTYDLNLWFQLLQSPCVGVVSTHCHRIVK